MTEQRTDSISSLASLVALAALVGAGPLGAQSAIPIINAGFEDPVTNLGQTGSPVVGWTNIAGGGVVFHPDTGQFPGGAAEGDNVLSLYSAAEGDGLSQVLGGGTGQLQADASYTLTVQVGDPADTGFDGYKLQLLAGGTLLVEDDDTVVPADGAFATATASYSYDAGLHAALVGEPLEIRLLSKGINNGETDFDDVQITVSLANPVANTGGPYSLFIGDSLALDGSNSLPSSGQALTSYEWDLDNDGTVDLTGAMPAAIAYDTLVDTPANGGYGMMVGDNVIKLRVTDDSSPAPKTSEVEGTVTILPPEPRFISTEVRPVFDEADQGYFNPSSPSSAAGRDKWFYEYNPNGYGAGASKGQTFTLTEDVLLKSVTYRLGTTNKPPTVDYLLRIGPVDTATNTFHPMFEQTVTQTIDWGIDDVSTDTYGTWSLGTPVTLPALPDGVVYAFDLTMTANDKAWQLGIPYPLFESSDVFTGGNKFTSPNVGSAGNPDTVMQMDSGRDREFHVDMETTTIEDTTGPILSSIDDEVAGGPIYDSQSQVSYLLRFDEAVDESTIDLADFENLGAGVSLDALVSVTNNSIFPLPSTIQVVFEISGTGTLQLGLVDGSDIADFYGNAVDSPVADDTVISVEVDTTAPVIDTLNPENGSAEVSLQPALVITFTDQSGIAVGSGVVEIKDATDGQVLQSIDVTSADVTMTGAQEATITVPSALSFGQMVYVNIDSGAFVDLSGNAFDGISDNTTWAFSTLALPAQSGPITQLAATTAGEDITNADFVHTFDSFPRLGVDHDLANSSDIALSAGHHLVIYNSRFDSTGGANRSEIQTLLNLDGTDLSAGWSQGYIRRTGSSYATITAGGAIIDVPNEGEILQLQTYRTDTNTGATVARADSTTFASQAPAPGPDGTTGIQILKLDDNWSYLRLAAHDGTGTDQSLPVGSDNPEPVVYNQELENDGGPFGFTPGSSDITLGQTGHYLVLANTYTGGGDAFNNREQVTQFLALDGTELPGTKTTTYIRDADNCIEGAVALGTIIETTAPDQVLTVAIMRDGTTAGGFIVGERSAVTIVKLPDSGDYIRLREDVEQDINTNMSFSFSTQEEVDSAFTHDATGAPTQVTVNNAGDYLFFASYFVPTADTGNARRFPNQGWQVNGADGFGPFGQTGRYNRHTAQTPSCGNWSGFMAGLSPTEYVEAVSRQMGDGGAENAVVALQGVRVDSLFGGTPPDSAYTTWAGGFGGLTDPDPALDFDGGGLQTGIEWVVGGNPSDPTDDAGLAPGMDTTSSPGNALFVFRQTDAAGADANTTITVEYGSDGENWTPAVNGTDGVAINVEDDGFAAGVDKVTVTLPDGLAVDGILLTRLNVVIATP